MTYQDNFQKWLDFAELPDYLRKDLEGMDEKTKEDTCHQYKLEKGNKVRKN